MNVNVMQQMYTTNVIAMNTANIVSNNTGGNKSRRGQTDRSASWEWSDRSVTQIQLNRSKCSCERSSLKSPVHNLRFPIDPLFPRIIPMHPTHAPMLCSWFSHVMGISPRARDCKSVVLLTMCADGRAYDRIVHFNCRRCAR